MEGGKGSRWDLAVKFFKGPKMEKEIGGGWE